MTPEDPALIDRAVAASGTDLIDFVIADLTSARRRVLADRTEFVLGPAPGRSMTVVREVGQIERLSMAS